jgi:type IV pilus assembly protein PilV
MKKNGFTLIEVLIALVILSVGLLGVAAMQTNSVRTNFFSRYLTQASYAAQDGLEALDNTALDAAGLQAGGHNDSSVSISGIAFNRAYQVVDDAFRGKVITYRVTWNDGIDREIAFSTVRSHQ